MEINISLFWQIVFLELFENEWCTYSEPKEVTGGYLKFIKLNHRTTEVGTKPMSTTATEPMVLVTRRGTGILQKKLKLQAPRLIVNHPPNLVQVDLMFDENREAKKQRWSQIWKV